VSSLALSVAMAAADASRALAQGGASSAAEGESEAPGAGTPSSEPDGPDADDPERGAAPAGETAPEGAPPVAPPPDPKLEEARERIARAESLYDEGDYDAALTEFQEVYELLEGHPMRPMVLFNIGKAYERLYRYDRAMDAYRRYLREMGPEAEDRAAVEAKIELLEGLLASLKLNVNVEDYEVWVDDTKVGEATTEVLVTGGSHVVEIRAAGYVPERQEVQLPARSEKTLSFELTALADEYQGLSPAYFWGSVGATVAMLAVGTAFGVRAINERNDIDARLEDPAERWLVSQRDRDEVSDLALRADVFFGLAVVFAGTATVLGVLTDWGGEAADGEGGASDGPADNEAGRLSVTPVAGSRHGGLILSGRF
jgi:tetratricopeptide (TPR) repeat protein